MEITQTKKSNSAFDPKETFADADHYTKNHDSYDIHMLWCEDVFEKNDPIKLNNIKYFSDSKKQYRRSEKSLTILSEDCTIELAEFNFNNPECFERLFTISGNISNEQGKRKVYNAMKSILSEADEYIDKIKDQSNIHFIFDSKKTSDRLEEFCKGSGHIGGLEDKNTNIMFEYAVAAGWKYESFDIRLRLYYTIESKVKLLQP